VLSSLRISETMSVPTCF